MKMTLHPVVGLLVVIAFVGMVFVLMLVPLPIDQTTHDLLVAFGGLLAGMANQVVAYYFGSSSGSQVKDGTIASMAATPRLLPESHAAEKSSEPNSTATTR
jgi:Fe2+ transport system protein B